jgi:hypothetical protein
MEHPQLGGASLPATVKPLWVPPSTPFYVYLRGDRLDFTYPVDLVDVQNPFRSEAERFNPWASRLGKQDIRLFAMQMDDKDTITGTLLAFERSKCPRYSALSYVCGQGTCDQEVYVNEGRLCVKPNLLAALKQFKSCMIWKIREIKGTPRGMLAWMWVDAISINQADAAEKAEQIGEMHHVYREASRIAVCLGHFGSGLGCVAPILRWVEGIQYPAVSGRRRWTQFELVEQLRDFNVSPCNLRAILDKLEIDLESQLESFPISSKNCNDAATRISKDQLLGFEESSVVASPMQRNHTFFGATFDILEHEWFSRVWTYQESSLAIMGGNSSRLNILLGDHAVPWTTFKVIEIAATVHSTHHSDSDNPSASLKKRIHRNMHRLVIESVNPSNHDGLPSLWSLLETSCQRRATVAKDHVFAVVGLMGPELRSRVLIDYSRSDASVFTDAFELAINHEGDGLRLPLCWERLALIPSITPELPSWCPDLVKEPEVSTDTDFWERLSHRTQNFYKRFANVRVSPSKKNLHLRVMNTDAVAQIFLIPCPGSDDQTHWDREIIFAGLLGTWFLRMHSSFSSADGQEDTPTFEPGLAALLWQYLDLSYGGRQESTMKAYLPGCSNFPHECVYWRLLTDPGWCFKKLLLYIRLVKCLRGNAFHLQHQRLGAHYDEGCSMCNLLRGPRLLAIADRCGVHIDRLSINLGSSKCGSLQSSGEARLLVALSFIGTLLGDIFQGMYIFKTAAGRYGFSPRRPSVGDHVCVVPGGRLLHIISADKSRYVGAASVVGLMDDKILEQDLFPDPEGRFEEVVLH